MEIDNIELSFGEKKILYGISLKAETGKVTGILGRNGSGKTCLLRILFGDLKAKYKNIRKDGKYQKRNLFQSFNAAYLPQHQLLPGKLKLNKAFRLFQTDWSTFIAYFDSFEKYVNARVAELSSGELRIVETYLVLCSNREVILLDEPFSFIAPLYVQTFKSIINEKKQTSVIVITDHFYRDIIDISDTVYFLKNGRSKLINNKSDLENEGYLSTDIKIGQMGR
ncbi:ATP-binding cassette domain-containing protein [Maribacter halichondriae]|uniref:ATP-binding cassette domain-containing protein n=1 Tax=Maribacter halichondriae TaxID=2980554 RepID=UPI0023583CBD|nr:ATP-binding cassette domain-containing protein [Maribacter sp. Hal144]